MKAYLNGIPLTVGTREEVTNQCLSLVGTGGLVFTVGALMAERARRDRDFLHTLLGADICTVDGFGVLAALRRGGVPCELFPGIELGEIIAASGSLRLALIGGRAGVGEKAFSYLEDKNPRLEKSFILDGFSHSESTYLDALRKSAPDVCFVCLGSPRQEQLAALGREVSGRTLFLALGGSLDVYSGNKPRAPSVMRRAGLEWLYRMIREPRRIAAIPTLLSYELHVSVEGQKSTKKSMLRLF